MQFASWLLVRKMLCKMACSSTLIILDKLGCIDFKEVHERFMFLQQGWVQVLGPGGLVRR